MGLATANSELDPFITADGLSLYYSPTSNSGPQRIVVAKRANIAAAFAIMTDVASVNDGGLSGNFDPVVFANERVIVFASTRSSNGGSAADNIWYATRPNATAAFDTPTLVPGVNSDFDDGDPHVSADGCRIYFSRRVGGGVDWELYTASSQ
jgi:Tol biopolymer transport system component